MKLPLFEVLLINKDTTVSINAAYIAAIVETPLGCMVVTINGIAYDTPHTPRQVRAMAEDAMEECE